MNVIVLGASNKGHRYSNIAVRRLKDSGHRVFPVHKTVKEVYGLPVLSSLSEVKDEIHTISVYVSKEVSDTMMDDIIRIRPKRIIFNPGSENYDLSELAEKSGIEVVFGCTLVMLASGAF